MPYYNNFYILAIFYLKFARLVNKTIEILSNLDKL